MSFTVRLSYRNSGAKSAPFCQHSIEPPKWIPLKRTRSSQPSLPRRADLCSNRHCYEIAPGHRAIVVPRPQRGNQGTGSASTMPTDDAIFIPFCGLRKAMVIPAQGAGHQSRHSRRRESIPSFFRTSHGHLPGPIPLLCGTEPCESLLRLESILDRLPGDPSFLR